MVNAYVVGAMLAASAIASLSAQARKPAGTKGVTYELSISADGGVYTGTLNLVTNAGKVSGAMQITQPTEITGRVSGTVKSGEFALDFPYRMVQRNCDGRIAMSVKAPVKDAVSKGTVSIQGCGRDATNKLAGTLELKRPK